MIQRAPAYFRIGRTRRDSWSCAERRVSPHAFTLSTVSRRRCRSITSQSSKHESKSTERPVPQDERCIAFTNRFAVTCADSKQPINFKFPRTPPLSLNSGFLSDPGLGVLYLNSGLPTIFRCPWWVLPGKQRSVYEQHRLNHRGEIEGRASQNRVPACGVRRRRHPPF